MDRRTDTVTKLVLTAGLLAVAAEAGVPLNGLQGNGGVAFNPLAYLAGGYAEGEKGGLGEWVSKPQVGAWYVNLDDADINWYAASAAFSVAKRLELSYGYGLVDVDGTEINTHNLGAKIKLLDENFGDTVFFGNVDILPAKNVAVGIEYKQGVDAGNGIQNSDYWDGHAAWFVTDKLTLVAAYADTGDETKGLSDLGVGGGLVLSAQYAF